MPEWIFDTVSLLNLADGDLLDYVEVMYGTQACVPYAVVEEILAGVPIHANAVLCANSLQREIPFPRIIPTNESIPNLLAQLNLPLGAGEATAIVITYQLTATLVSDDRKARQIAKQLGIAVTGTLGVLVKLVQMDIITVEQANHALDIMRSSGFFSPVRTIDELIPS